MHHKNKYLAPVDFGIYDALIPPACSRQGVFPSECFKEDIRTVTETWI